MPDLSLRSRRAALSAGLALLAAATAGAQETVTVPVPNAPAAEAATTAPTVAEATAFVERAERELMELAKRSGRAQWVAANFITADTQEIAAEYSEQLTGATVRLAIEAARYRDLDLPADVRRKLDLMRSALAAPAPTDPAKTSELARIMAEMEGHYGSATYCPEGASGDDCLDLEEMTEILAHQRDDARLLEVWKGWHDTAAPIRDEYRRFVELTGEGARELGFEDLGALWRSTYDMDPDAFAAEVERLWTQVEPLYDSLHCYVRAELADQYGADVVRPGEPIPAHLLGNMWAQEWGNIYPLVSPGESDAGYDLSELLERAGYDAEKMVETAEGFFTSLGFPELSETFYERSLFVKPQDRDVVCHASAWDIDYEDDQRIKMCIDITAEDFQTIHHELGHIYYFTAYNHQPFAYRDGAHDGFHEAVGDAIALSMTPNYLKQIGLLEEEPPASADLGLLLRDALDKIAFLPFGLVVDQWRWRVFSGDIAPEEYNTSWWQMREQYQGIRPAVERTEGQFDPGAKFHVPANTPYTRYFLARILQFQFHRELCAAAGYEGPLHRCSIYGSEEAGSRLIDMLAEGRSKPWPETLARLTGSGEMDATAIVDYFAPLLTWLDEQNQGRQCGW